MANRKPEHYDNDEEGEPLHGMPQHGFPKTGKGKPPVGWMVSAVLAWWPGLFDSAQTVAALYGCDPATGFLFIAAPLMALVGLPAWWLVRASVRWFDRRRDKDIGELAADAAAAVKEVRTRR